MSSSPVPPAVHDADRLESLAAYGILDTPAEPGFDDIVQLACQLCDMPVALVSLVAEDRQWFKAQIGFPHCETDLNSSVCAHALAQPDELLIIPDLTTDPRTSANPLVTGDPFIRFYAGAPLRTARGLVLGTLCVIDKKPRPNGLSASQQNGLRLLARQVLSQLELRRAVEARDVLRVNEGQAYRTREALRDTQLAISAAEGDLQTILTAVIDGAMQALPAADGGVFELLDGAHLEYHATRGAVAAHAGLRIPLDGSGAGFCARSGAPYLMVDASRDPHVKRELIGTLQIGSAVFAPVLRGVTVLGVLKLQSRVPIAFNAHDLAQLAMFAGAATSGLAEAAARAETRAQDTYWRGLFQRLSEGFIVGEVVRAADGAITDWRYVEVNPAWGKLVGVDPMTVVGRTIRETFPGIEDAWVDEFARVVVTGEQTTFVRQVGTLRRWYEGRAFRVNRDRFGIIFSEITSRVEADARRAAMLALGDRLRDLTSAAEMTAAAAEIVGRTLGATRAGFGRVVGDVEFIDIDADWTAPGHVSLTGRHAFDEYGDFRGELRRGEALVINDVTADARTAADPAALQAIGVGAMVNMPVRDRGRTVALFVAHDANPRVWTPEELAFLRNVADRLEVGVARVQGEELQGVLNAELAHRLKNTLAIVQSIASQTLRGVSERPLVEAFERRVLALSRAHDVLIQKSWTAARMRAVMESVLAIQADLDRFALDGPDLDISPQAALSLSLLLHEMATNALKYGALSTGAGTVRISWRTEIDQSPALVLDWAEIDGPPVEPPSGRGGFGSKLIRMGLLGTRIAVLDYTPLGLRAEFRAPLSEVQVLAH